MLADFIYACETVVRETKCGPSFQSSLSSPYLAPCSLRRPNRYQKESGANGRSGVNCRREQFRVGEKQTRKGLSEPRLNIQTNFSAGIASPPTTRPPK